MPPFDAASSAFVVIDVQQGFDEIEAAGARRNNPDALSKLSALLAACRQAGVRVVHVRHASREAQSVFRPERPGFAVIASAREVEGEMVIVKSVNSAFIGTDLETHLRRAGVETLFIAGVTTNHCVETTTRMAGNLGFRTFLVEDACWTFDRAGPDGVVHSAASVHAMTLANLSGEFATIVDTSTLIQRLPRAQVT